MKIVHKSRLLAVNKDQLLVVEKVGFVKKLTLPGGVKKRSETLENSLIREAFEEVGLLVNYNQLTHLISYAQVKTENIVVKHHFTAQLKTNLFQVKETEKFKDVYWLHWTKALPYLDKEDKRAVKKYFKKISNKKLKQLTNESSIPPSIAM